MDRPARKRRRGRSGRRPGGSRPPEEQARDPRPQRAELCELAPFAVFCAYYLGITPGDGYAPQTPAAVARRFGLTEAELRGYLVEHALDPDRMRTCGFDLEGASLDIRVAPDGVSRTELARTLFEEYRTASSGS